MNHTQHKSLISYFLKSYPRQSALVVPPLVIAGIAESITVVALLPLLEIALQPEASQNSILSQFLIDGLRWIGLTPTLGTLIGLIIFVMFLRGLILFGALWHAGRIVTLVSADLRQQFLNALVNARWTYFTGQPVGHFANAISIEIHEMTYAFRAACYVLAAGLHILLYLGLLLLLSWQATLVALISGIIVMFAWRSLFSMVHRAGHQRAVAMKSLTGLLSDTLSGLKSLKAMGQESHVWPFLRDEVESFSSAHLRAVTANELMKAFHEPVFVVLLGVGFFVAMQFGNMSVTTLLVLAALLFRLITHIGQIQENMQVVVVGEGAFASFQTQMRAATAAREPSGADFAPQLNERIVFDHVTFGYEDEPILRDLSFAINTHQIVAFVGASGAGKTTLIDLLVGLLEPQAGEILIDGTPLRCLDLTHWRRQIGYVPQDPLLSNNSIYANVALGKNSRAEVEAALRMAGAWEFTSAFPEGMDRLVGERGMQLSGGQRQRISIARALVDRPKLLILDEATTALDPQTEREICDTLLKLRDEMTIIAISHQIAIQQIADFTLYVGGGDVRATQAER